MPGRDAGKSFDLIADELVPVDLAGSQAWVLAADESAVRSAEPMSGVRLLPAPDLRLFGQDRAQLFVGPGKNDHSPLQDWFHPHGLVVNGRIAGAWGRRGGQVNIKATGPLAPSAQHAIHAEAESMPIPNRNIRPAGRHAMQYPENSAPRHWPRANYPADPATTPQGQERHNSVTGLPATVRIVCRLTRRNG